LRLTSHLSDSVNAADEQAGIGNAHCPHEHPELLVDEQCGASLVLSRHSTTLERAPRPEQVISSQAAKHKQDDYLKHNTRHNNPVSMLQQSQVGPASRRGDAAADGLDDQAGNVGGHEEDGVELWREAAERAVQGADSVFQGEIQADADQAGAEDDGDDLNLEGIGVPGIVGEEDAGGVACGG
jgi:hypothetical protein